DEGLPAQSSISSIVQLGEDLFCGHPDGIYKSSDKGKTWKLLLCSKDGKVYNLTVSGNVIYAIPRVAGC
ncbi:MAG: exo-alpha-sialidase, partial [Sphingobacteriales bacterium]